MGVGSYQISSKKVRCLPEQEGRNAAPAASMPISLVPRFTGYCNKQREEGITKGKREGGRTGVMEKYVNFIPDEQYIHYNHFKYTVTRFFGYLLFCIYQTTDTTDTALRQGLSIPNIRPRVANHWRLWGGQIRNQIQNL